MFPKWSAGVDTAKRAGKKLASFVMKGLPVIYNCFLTHTPQPQPGYPRTSRQSYVEEGTRFQCHPTGGYQDLLSQIDMSLVLKSSTWFSSHMHVLPPLEQQESFMCGRGREWSPFPANLQTVIPLICGSTKCQQKIHSEIPIVSWYLF